MNSMYLIIVQLGLVGGTVGPLAESNQIESICKDAVIQIHEMMIDPVMFAKIHGINSKINSEKNFYGVCRRLEKRPVDGSHWND